MIFQKSFLYADLLLKKILIIINVELHVDSLMNKNSIYFK